MLGKRFNAVARATLVLLAVAVVMVLGAYAWIHHDGNVHVVQAGQFYRSQQLDPELLAAVVEKHAIRSVINLRGANPGKPWYEQEIAESRALKVAHFDYALSARQKVSPEQIAEILAIIRTAPKPLLVHCKAGADRTGLISAVYEFEVEGKTPQEADQQLAIRYGHFPYLTSKTSAMDDSFWSYVNGRKRLGAR